MVNYELYNELLKYGDIIVIEINGKILKNPQTQVDQYFMVKTDQKEKNDIQLMPIGSKSYHKVKKYRAGWK